MKRTFMGSGNTPHKFVAESNKDERADSPDQGESGNSTSVVEGTKQGDQHEQSELAMATSHYVEMD